MKKNLEIISYILSVIIIGVLLGFYIINVNTDINENMNEITDRDMLEIMSHGHTH